MAGTGGGGLSEAGSRAIPLGVCCEVGPFPRGGHHSPHPASDQVRWQVPVVEEAGYEADDLIASLVDPKPLTLNYQP